MEKCYSKSMVITYRCFSLGDSGLRRNILLGLLLILSIAGINQSITVAASGGPQVSQTTELHPGDFIVEAGQTRTIEGVTLTIDGNIIVKESARLIIRNADLTVKSIAKGYYIVWLHENSIVEVENSRLREGPIPGLDSWRGIIGGETGFMAYGGLSGKVIMRNTMSDLRIGSLNAMIESSVLPLILWEPSCQITVKDSEIKILDLRFRGEAETINITGLRKGEVIVERKVVEQRTPHFRFSSAEGGYLELENTLVATWNLNMFNLPGSPMNEKHLIIRDSEICDLWLAFPVGSRVHLRGLDVGIPMNWNLHKDSLEMSGVLFDITLINTTLERYKIEIQGEGVVEDSEGVFLNTIGNGTATVKNSTVDSSFFRGGRISYLDSYITRWMRFLHWVNPTPPGITIPSEVTIHFENCTLADGGLEFDSEDYVTITGTISISIPMSNVNFVSGTVIREYPLLVKDDEGAPVSKASLILKDAENQQVWSGETDQAGRAAFNLTFTKENYTRSYTLSATAHGLNVSTELGLLESTPIILTLRKSPLKRAPWELYATIAATAIVAVGITVIIYKRRRASSHTALRSPLRVISLISS